MLSHQRPEQSIRSSCDRCRSSKLKCVPSSDSDPSAPCQRCLRARATCVFGQRARSKRGPRRLRQSMSPVSEEWRPDASGDETPRSRSSTSSIRMCSPSDLRQSHEERQPLSEAVIIPRPNMTSTIPTAWATNGIMAIPNSDSSMNEWRETPWTNSNLNNMWTDKSLPVSSGGFIQDFQMPQGPMTPSSLSRSEDLDFGDMILQTIDENTSTWQASSSPPNGGGVCPQLELSALLGEMQKYLHMLKIYHVSENRFPEDALNDYPIGEALYLLRRFCELQERVRPTGRSPSWTQSPIDPDMVAALVIVTCYMTMMRILHALFGHLEQYLSQITPETAMKARKNLAEHCRSLKLGELTPVNNVCVRTREAVGTLLSALRGMDMAIGTYHKMPWAADEMDDVTDCPAENTAREDGLTVNLLKEENISSKIDKDKTLLYAKILEVERHLDRLLNCSAGGQTAIA